MRKIDQYDIKVILYFGIPIVVLIALFLPIFVPGILAPLLRSVAPTEQVASDGYTVTVEPQFLSARSTKSFTIGLKKDGKPAQDRKVRLGVNFMRYGNIEDVFNVGTYYGVTNQQGVATIAVPILHASMGWDNPRLRSIELYVDGQTSNEPMLEVLYLGAERTRGDYATWYYGPQFHWISNVYSVIFFVLSALLVVGAWFAYKTIKSLRT